MTHLEFERRKYLHTKFTLKWQNIASATTNGIAVADLCCELYQAKSRFTGEYFPGLLVTATVVAIPSFVGSALNVLATILIASAITAAGINSNLADLTTHGVKPLMIIIASSVVALVLSLSAAVVLL